MPMPNLTDCLERWSTVAPDRPLYTFINRACNPVGSYTYASFHLRTNGLAHVLAREIGIKPGESILLVYPPGLEFIVAFIACVKAGALPIPLPAPIPSAFSAARQRLRVVSENAGAVQKQWDVVDPAI